jgi:F-type H+-transporting ATPase subunit a
MFIPSGIPGVMKPLMMMIEMISYLSRVISLGVRLGGNMMSGHILKRILNEISMEAMSSMIIPGIGMLMVITLEMGVSVIQGYVMCVLTSMYIRESY